MASIFHGDGTPDCIPLIEMFLERRGRFQGLWDQLETAVVTDVNTSAGDQGKAQYGLRLDLYRHDGQERGIRLRCGYEITKEKIERFTKTKAGLITGKQLLDMAKGKGNSACKYIKSAVAFGEYLVSQKVGSETAASINLPSGTTFPDLLEDILKKMHEDGGAGSCCSADETGDDGDETPGSDGTVSDETGIPNITPSTPPTNYMFPGFMAFVAFGPFSCLEKHLQITSILGIATPNAESKRSRKDQRKALAEEKNRKRELEIDNDNSTFKRGRKAGDLASEQRKIRESRRKSKHSILLTLLHEHNAKHEIYKMMFPLAVAHAPGQESDPENFYWKKVLKAEKDVEEFEKKIACMRAELAQLDSTEKENGTVVTRMG